MSITVTPIKKKVRRQIINCCPHDIVIFTNTVLDDCGKSHGGEHLMTIEPSGFLASAKSSIVDMAPVELNDIPVPTVTRTFSRVTELPNNGNLYIVSSVFAQACKELGKNVSNLLTPYGTVVDENDNVIGCTKLVRYA